MKINIYVTFCLPTVFFYFSLRSDVQFLIFPRFKEISCYAFFFLVTLLFVPFVFYYHGFPPVKYIATRYPPPRSYVHDTLSDCIPVSVSVGGIIIYDRFVRRPGPCAPSTIAGAVSFRGRIDVLIRGNKRPNRHARRQLPRLR